MRRGGMGGLSRGYAGLLSAAAVGRSGSNVVGPSWLPTTEWEWTDVPGSEWIDYAPSLEVPDTTAYSGYIAQWDYSAPTYSRAHHEVYMFGGGHAGTAINAVSRYLLDTNSPSVEFFVSATSAADRAAWVADANYLTTTYFPDGKGYAPHSYGTLQYSDYTDEMLFSFVAMGQGIPFQGAGWSTSAIGAVTRAGTWRAAGYYDPHPSVSQNTWRMARCLSYDGTKLYYWSYIGSGETSDNLNVLDLDTREHSVVGACALTMSYRRVSHNGDKILVLGSENSGGAWLAYYVNPDTGASTSVTVSGDSIPSGKGIYDLVWCEDQGYWLTVWMDAARVYDWVNASGTITVATITPTGASTATAEIRTISTGDGAYPYHKAYRGVFYDPAWGVALFVTHPQYPIKAIKVGA